MHNIGEAQSQVKSTTKPTSLKIPERPLVLMQLQSPQSVVSLWEQMKKWKSKVFAKKSKSVNKSK